MLGGRSPVVEHLVQVAVVDLIVEVVFKGIQLAVIAHKTVRVERG